MSEWQPIETAPKDGQTIVAFRNEIGKGAYTLIFWDDVEGQWAGLTATHEKMLAKHQPTHWIPLPPRPVGIWS
jgi:hypothetical protein